MSLVRLSESEYLQNTRPRDKLLIATDDVNVPSTEVLDQLCFVTGADANYFEMVVELVESIKATKHYKKTPIAVVDCGLAKEHIDYLWNRFNCIIKDPGWDVRVKQNTPNHIKSLTVRNYMDVHFPGPKGKPFRYYLWIDSDAWVQCEYALHNFVNLCAKQGWALCRGLHPSKLTAYRIPWKDKMSVITKPALNCGVFCIDAKSKYISGKPQRPLA